MQGQEEESCTVEAKRAKAKPDMPDSPRFPGRKSARHAVAHASNFRRSLETHQDARDGTIFDDATYKQPSPQALCVSVWELRIDWMRFLESLAAPKTFEAPEVKKGSGMLLGTPLAIQSSTS